MRNDSGTKGNSGETNVQASPHILEGEPKGGQELPEVIQNASVSMLKEEGKGRGAGKGIEESPIRGTIADQEWADSRRGSRPINGLESRGGLENRGSYSCSQKR